MEPSFCRTWTNCVVISDSANQGPRYSHQPIRRQKNAKVWNYRERLSAFAEFCLFRRSRSDSISRYSIFSDSFYKVVNIQSCIGAGRWRRRSSALSTINLLRRWGDQNIFCQCKNRHKRGCYVYTQPLTPLWYSNFVRGTGGVEMLDQTNTDLFLTIYIWHFLEWYTNSFLTLNAWNCLFCIYILYPLKTCLKDLFSTMFVKL